MVEAAPSPSFKMSQPDLLLEFLIVAFDPPSQLGNVDELAERDVLRKRRQPIFDRLLLAFGPFNQQPLLRPTVGEPVIPVVSRIFRTFGWLSGARPWLTR